MTREQYLQLRPNNNEYPMELFYNFYKDNKGDLPIQQFMEIFPIFVQQLQMTNLMLKVSQNVLNYYDSKFNIVILSDKDNKQLKVM